MTGLVKVEPVEEAETRIDKCALNPVPPLVLVRREQRKDAASLGERAVAQGDCFAAQGATEEAVSDGWSAGVNTEETHTIGDEARRSQEEHKKSTGDATTSNNQFEDTNQKSSKLKQVDVEGRGSVGGVQRPYDVRYEIAKIDAQEEGRETGDAQEENDTEVDMHEDSVMCRGKQIRSWEEEMIENKDALKLAVELGAIPCSDEEDIMAILQEQNEAIALKRRQSKRKEKIRRSRPKCQKQVYFNKIVHIEERKGTTNLSASAEDFRAWINDIELVDLTINDRKYTWFRGHSRSHIDRSLVNLEWLDVYPDTHLRRGPRGLSDHCPLIVEDRRIAQGPRPFCSLDTWFTHEGFRRMMKEEWRGLDDI
ncbi:hypothetical protein AHAS_Ahas04G0095400 [Arachis hypogaea]